MTNPNLSKTDAAALSTGDIKHFLKPYFTFRVYVQFSKNRKKCHFYGNEHECTLKQLQYGQVPHIKLSRLKGYSDLIRLVETTWQGKLQVAKIYMRQTTAGPFDVLCRHYYQGQLVELNDPVIDDSNDIRTLYYQFQTGHLYLSELNPVAANAARIATLEETVDFKSEVANALNKNH